MVGEEEEPQLPLTPVAVVAGPVPLLSDDLPLCRCPPRRRPLPPD